MHYRLRLKIEYAYEGASDHARNLLHVLPCDLAGRQRLIAHSLVIDPAPNERRDMRDFFGNVMTAVAFHQPIDRFALILNARIQRTSAGPQLDFSPRLPRLARELVQERRLDASSPHHFIANSPLVTATPAMTAFARDCIRPDMTAMQVVEALGATLHREMKFDPKATEVDTPVAEAFTNRHGVCQDFSHIMIACLRQLGIPAGYVSGFLRTLPPEGEARLEGADAMHAWVRAWCGAETGWVEFDPTNDMRVGHDHIVVAFGRDYSDVSPVRGTMRSAGRQRGRHSVDVVPVTAEGVDA